MCFSEQDVKTVLQTQRLHHDTIMKGNDNANKGVKKNANSFYHQNRKTIITAALDCREESIPFIQE